MKLNLYIASLAMTILSCAPAMAHDTHESHFVESAIACDYGRNIFLDFGGFSRFVNSNGLVWTGGFRNPGSVNSPFAGIRVKGNQVPFKNWTMDVKLSGNPNQAVACTFFRTPNGVFGEFDDFTTTPLSNGYTRWTFTAPTDDISNPRLDKLFFLQYAQPPVVPSSDMVKNIRINGVLAVPDGRPWNYDCTPDDFCFGCAGDNPPS